MADLPELKFDSTPQASNKLPELNFDAKPSPNMGDLAWDTYARAGMGAYNATKWIPGVKELANITPGKSADELSAGIPKGNLGQQVVGGTGQALATLPQMLPFVKAAETIPLIAQAGKFGLGGLTAPAVGMAGYGATKAAATGQPIIPEALDSAKQGLIFGAGGAAGSAASQMVFNPIARLLGGGLGASLAKAAPVVGSSLGSGGASAILSPEGDKASSAIVGAGMGALNPVGGNDYNKVLQEAADAHQKMLNLGKGVIQKVEMKSGKDLQDSYKLAAQHGLIYNKFEGNKTDTTQAQEQIQPFISQLHDQANDIVSSDPSKKFDLKQWGEDVKSQLENNPKFKNDLALKQAKALVDSHVNAAIENRGQEVSAPELNEIKQGMWGQSFQPLAPNENAVARQMGNTAKDMLEKSFPGSGLKDVNAKLGQYLDLKAILVNAHGNTVPGGKLGNGWAGGIGAATGMAASHFAPNPEVAGMMTLGGTKAGMMLNEHMNNPSTISKSVADKVKFSQMANGINPNPQVGTSNYQPLVNPIAQQVFGLPAPQPQYLQERANAPIESLGVQDKNLPLNANPLGQFSQPKEGEAAKLENNRRQSARFQRPQGAIFDIRGDAKPSEEVKKQAKEIINQGWQEGITNPLNQVNHENIAKKVLGIGAATLGAGMFAKQANASEDIDISKINQIESSGQGDAMGDKGKAFGINQIHEGTLKDFNKAMKKNYTTEDMMSKLKNDEVANWRYNIDAPKWLKKHEIEDNVQNRISYYNEGPGNYLKRLASGKPAPKITTDYYEKYKKAK